jgi:predicted Zn finger-like uncharacterized protein
MAVIRCPACDARYQVAEAASGKRTRCRKCGQTFRIPVLPQAQEPPAEDLRLIELSALADGQPVGSGPAVRPVQPAEAVPVEAVPLPATESVSYATGPTGEEAAAARGAYGRYFRSLAQSLAFPIRTGDLITFFIVWVILVVGQVIAPFALCFAPVVAVIVAGWYMSFQLNVVIGAADGEEDLPTLALTSGWWDDIIVPFVKMLSVSVVIWIPAIVFLLATGLTRLLAAGAGSSLAVGGPAALVPLLDPQTVVIGGLLVAAGHFLWPMLVLIVAVGGVAGVVRVDLMGRTIARSLPAYLITVLAVYLSLGLTAGSHVLVGPVARGLGRSAVILLPAGLLLIELYFTIIAMRAIGFYYHHFKHKFAWSWG